MPHLPGSASVSRHPLTPWVLGVLAFFTATSIVASREPLLSAASLLPLWAIGFAIHHYLPQLRIARLYFAELHAYLRALDKGVAPSPAVEHLHARVRDSVGLTDGEQAEFKRLMNEAGIKD